MLKNIAVRSAKSPVILAGLFFFMCFLAYQLAPRHWSVNHTSRLALTHAIVDRGTYDIDHVGEAVYDWAKHGGHYYTNKAPGSSFAAVPPYLALKAWRSLTGQPAANGYEVTLFVSIFISIIPSLLAGFMIFSLTGRLLLAAVYLLATICWAFSTMPWGHPTAAFFLIASYWLQERRRRGGGFWAGLSFGCAVLTEYSAALALPLFAWNLWPRRRDLLLFALGGLAPASLFFHYHYRCFGGPLSLAPESQNEDLNGLGRYALFGVLGLPSPKVSYNLLLGVERGLFIISPLLALAPWGLWRSLRGEDRSSRKRAFLCLLLFTAFLAFNAGYNGWHGGHASGPRYLVPALPFLVLLLAPLRAGALFLLLGAWSLVNNAAIASVNTMAIPGYNLMYEIIYPNILKPDKLPHFLTLLPLALMAAGIAWFHDSRVQLSPLDLKKSPKD